MNSKVLTPKVEVNQELLVACRMALMELVKPSNTRACIQLLLEAIANAEEMDGVCHD